MPAFDRISSGIPGLDKSFDNIRLGDNVVFRVSSLDDFRCFVRPYVRQAFSDNRKIIYVRFADHDPILSDEEIKAYGIDVQKIELSHRFETFTVSVHNLIRDYGYDAFYVFDCLSVLTTAWATDLMMGNFFRVTCPYLFSLNTVAFFPVLRGRHSLSAVAKIQDTTQLFIDVYPGDTNLHKSNTQDSIAKEAGSSNSLTKNNYDSYSSNILYVRPLKVWNRYSETMFLPHIFNTKTLDFRPILDGVEASAFYNVLGRNQRSSDEQNIDSWDRFFFHAESSYENGEDMSEYTKRMCNIMMSRDSHMRSLIQANFKPIDYFEIKRKMVGTGMIGGKACGMLTARKIIENKAPQIYAKFEPHDSFYVGSDVFYSYLVDNGLWDLRVRQRSEEGYFSLADEFSEGIRHGKFSADTEQEILMILDYYGQDPYIVRSSSILEDGFGNAFAGKYESVFCLNQGSIEDRLQEFENAARIVYASTMNKSALEYRKIRGLEKRDEQMALLVQRVSGSRYGKFVMPCAAGVGYSTSPYKMAENVDTKKGMLRLVMGLGTAAVDRTEGSYPRIVNLDKPTYSLYSSSKEKHEFSQKKVEYLDLSYVRVASKSDVAPEFWDDANINSSAENYDKNVQNNNDDKIQNANGSNNQNITSERTAANYYSSSKSSSTSDIIKNTIAETSLNSTNGCVMKASPDLIAPLLPQYIKNTLFEHDYDAEIYFSNMGRDREVTFVSCLGLSENKSMMDTFSNLLQTLEKEYEYPVDIEFTINLSHDNGFIINLLQCRPLQTLSNGKENESISVPENLSRENTILSVQKSSMGMSMSFPVDEIVFVDPKEYYELTYMKKPDVANIIGRLNEEIRALKKKAVLFVPGRIGTSSPELGVPVSFAKISDFSAICEIAESSYGYNPELSYGSHIFQDLVETKILYTAIFENENTEIFQPEKLKTGQPVKEGYPVYVLENTGFTLFHDITKNITLITKR